LDAAEHLAWTRLIARDRHSDARYAAFHAKLLQKALTYCKCVNATVGSEMLSMSYDEQVAKLRQTFDPDDEVSATYWPSKVYEVEEWLDIERLIAAHKAPRPDSPASKVKRASLALSAGTSCVAVAKRLGVSRSTVSKWKVRYPAAFSASSAARDA
jgi:hypothetical protein